MLPLRSNISVVQSIVLDRRLLELELGRLVTDNMACLFNFLFCDGNVSYYKSLPTRSSCVLSVWLDCVCTVRRRKTKGKQDDLKSSIYSWELLFTV